ncbi:MAG: S41 family peptidase [Bacteroidota bacterium]
MKYLLFIVLMIFPGFIRAQVIISSERPKLTLNQPAISELLKSICSNIDKYYLYPVVAQKMIADLNNKFDKGAFNDVTNPVDFAQTITKEIRETSHDLHMNVVFDPMMAHELIAMGKEPDQTRKPPPDILSGRRQNYGFAKTEILQGNVGYLKLNQFADVQYGSETAVAAMNFLSNADALIIDVRANGGGDGAMVNLLCSYLLNPTLHINSSYFRDTTKNEESWTAAYVPGKRLTTIPVYVLTSTRTFSAAEEFAYDLQTTKRATIIGETTGGGAHHNQFVPIDSNFAMSVSIGEAINPITHKNWEGTGVIPDVAIPQDKALEVAQIEAMKNIRESAVDEQQKRSLDWAIDELNAEANPVTPNESTLKKYAGVYGERTITFENGSLYYQRKGKAKYKMIPMTENLFMFHELEYFRLRFTTDDSGNVKLSGMYDNGMID